MARTARRSAEALLDEGGGRADNGQITHPSAGGRAMPRRSLLVALGVVLACQGCGKGKPAQPAGSYVPPWERPTPFVALGIRQPPVKAAADAGLADDVAVVGVV